MFGLKKIRARGTICLARGELMKSSTRSFDSCVIGFIHKLSLDWKGKPACRMYNLMRYQYYHRLVFIIMEAVSYNLIPSTSKSSVCSLVPCQAWNSFLSAAWVSDIAFPALDKSSALNFFDLNFSLVNPLS